MVWASGEAASSGYASNEERFCRTDHGPLCLRKTALLEEALLSKECCCSFLLDLEHPRLG